MFLKSNKTKWLSVPPVKTWNPFLIKLSARLAAFFMTCSWYSLNLGSKASLKATAFAAITCSKGPPCVLGNTAKSIKKRDF